MIGSLCGNWRAQIYQKIIGAQLVLPSGSAIVSFICEIMRDEFKK